MEEKKERGRREGGPDTKGMRRTGWRTMNGSIPYTFLYSFDF